MIFEYIERVLLDVPDMSSREAIVKQWILVHIFDPIVDVLHKIGFTDVNSTSQILDNDLEL